MSSRSKSRAGLIAGVAAATLAAAAVPAVAAGGAAVPDGTYRFAARITDGTGHGCSGVLVAPQWILTARQCVESPSGPLTAVIGKANVTTSAGYDRAVVRTVVHPSLDLALARTSVPAQGIAAPAISSTPPTAGETLTLLGYGRTASTWVPDDLHRTTGVVSAVGDGTVDVAAGADGGPLTCKGDAGGPAIRDNGGVVQLVALHVSSTQAGCLAETGTQAGAVEARVDVAASWIAATVRATPRTDFTGDGHADVAGIDANNDLKLYAGDGAGKLSGGTAMTSGSGAWKNYPAISAGDFDGDGFADLAGITASSDMMLYRGDGTGKLATGTAMWPTGGSWAGFKHIAAGDFNGDGKADIAGIDANNDMKLYVGDGAGKLSGGTAMLGGSGLWKNFVAIAPGDFNGDGKLDIAGIDANNDMKLYPGDGAGKLGSGVAMLGGSGLWKGFVAVTAGDFNGDGKLDIAGIDANFDMRLYVGDGAGKVSGGTAMWATGGLWKGFKHLG